MWSLELVNEYYYTFSHIIILYILSFIIIVTSGTSVLVWSHLQPVHTTHELVINYWLLQLLTSPTLTYMCIAIVWF